MMETPVELTAPVPLIMSSTNVDQPKEDVSPQNSNHGEAAQAEPELEVSPEEMRSIITVIATTGKFWHDWLFLRSILSVQMKQVLAEYPETQRSSLSGETYDELVLRLKEALINFDEGPPFTLQRVCEILLSPKSTYSNLSKLALALEKNLLVTSTLTRCTEPYPKVPTSPEQQPEESTVPVPGPGPSPVDHAVAPPTDPEPKSEPNGAETTSEGQPVVGDTDEEMPDAEPETEPEEQNPNPPDVEMQDMEEKATKEEEKAVQEEKVEEVEVVENDESTVAVVCQSDLDSATVPDGEETVTADKVDPPSGEPVVEP